jgi:hypothetical protein
MKKTILIAACTLSLLAAHKSDAQVSVNVQFGTPVMNTSWYGADADYYYIPQYGVYYNCNRRMYVYPQGGSWCYGPTLPACYGAYNFAPGSYYQVHARAPFRNHGYYQSHYAYRPVPQPYNCGPRGGGYYGGGHHDNGNHNGWYKHDNQGGGRGNGGGYADDRHYGNNGQGNDDNRGGNGHGGRGGYRH